MEPTAPQNHRVRHTFGMIFGLTGLVWLGIFLGWVVYFLWQGKYGTDQEIAKTKFEFQNQKFTAATGAKDGPKAPANWTEYITNDNPAFGNPTNPLTIVAFIDFECPFSQEGYPIFKSIIETYGSAAKIVFKQLPLTSIHPNALPAAEAAACANEQGKFWQYYNYLFNTKKLSTADLTTTAAAVGLDMTKFAACQTSNKYRSAIEKDVNDAIALGVRGTPTYFVNNEVIEGVVDRAAWDTIILRNLKK